MKINFEKIIEIECPSVGYRAKYAYKLLKYQCDSFEFVCNGKNWNKLLVTIRLAKEADIFWTQGRLHLHVTKSADMSLALLLQLWAIANDGIILHGAMLKFGTKGIVVTGKGGVGKTHLALNHCKANNEEFVGDDLVFFKKDIFYPVLRPLCIYPEHLNIPLDEITLGDRAKIISVNSFTVRVIRKIIFIFSMYFPILDRTYKAIQSLTTSSKAYAYVPSQKLGLAVSTSQLECAGLIAINRGNTKSRYLSKDPDSIFNGTKSEYHQFYYYLDFMIDNISSGVNFDEYLARQIREATKLNHSKLIEKISSLLS